MTLILGVITRDYVALASDRRLTKHMPSDPRHGQPITDNRNKTIVVCNHFHVGYTGLANIGRQRTDEWAAQQLTSNQSNYDAFVTLTEEATKAFRPLPPSLRRHAFLGVGWVTGPSSPDALIPIFVLISNALNERLQWLPQAKDYFTRQSWTLAPDREYLLGRAGRDLSPEEATQLEGYVRGHVQRGSTPRGAAFLLGDFIRKVADRDTAVGRGILLSVLSRSAVGEAISGSLTGAPGAMDEHNCWYIPADDERNNPVQYPPTYVCPGIAMTRGEVWTTKPPWWKD